MTSVLLFPAFDPVIVELGPLAIRWYALAYIAGLVAGWRLVRRLAQQPPVVATPLQVDDFLTWATLGVVLGGRLGYVLFYQPGTYLSNPLSILAVWGGGMSFHGGMLGVAIAVTVFCRRNRIPLLGFADRIAAVAPIGLGLGRVANFVNGELWGRAAPLWWPGAMVFPRAEGPGGPDIAAYDALKDSVCAAVDVYHCVPRFPSQLYQAVLEGALLFALVYPLVRLERVRARPGLVTGVFLCGYGLARIAGEFFREPDAFLGFLAFGATMGQVLSVPMVLAGAWLIARSRRA
jgi:phosphatidylglycerol:prolipoprotein diacylglycerol transferase